jgi:hypothetical protein
MASDIDFWRFILLLGVGFYCILYPFYSRIRGYIRPSWIFGFERIYQEKEPIRFRFWFFFDIVLGIVILILCIVLLYTFPT